MLAGAVLAFLLVCFIVFDEALRRSSKEEACVLVWVARR